MKSRIYLSSPNLIGNEKKYIYKCLTDNWLVSQGFFSKKFENKLSLLTKSKYVASCVNATSALHLALKVLGIKKKDEVIIPTLTFIAPVNSIVYNDAIPIFMDVDNYFNIDVNKTIDFIRNETFIYKDGYTYNKKTKNKIFAILVVHVFGNAANLDKLISICKKRKIKIIEDASESLGTIYTKGKLKGKHTGTIGDAGIISFNGNKIMTSGGGGVFLTKFKKNYEKFVYLANQAKDKSIYSKHDEIGYNYQMSNLHAAIGLAQLENYKNFLKIKYNIFRNYNNLLDRNKIFSIYKTPDYAKNNKWLNILKIKNNKVSINKLINLFSKNNIEVRPIWKLNHLQKEYKKYQRYKIIKAPKLINNSLCLPSSTHLTKVQMNKIIKILGLLK